MIIRLLTLLLIVCACGEKRNKPLNAEPASTAPRNALQVRMLADFSVKNTADYRDVKQSCNTLRDELTRKYRDKKSSSQEIVKEAGELLTKKIINEIIPHWYGTPWDFNGYTDKPLKGVIACGYFVSTTLQHTGFNVNRYTLAQQDPYHEALTINLSENLISIRNDGKDTVTKYFNEHNMPDGLYFVGLDFHVGYLYKNKKELFFIHSNYIQNAGVMIEVAGDSEAFSNTSQYYVANITNNTQLIRKWILNEPVIVKIP